VIGGRQVWPETFRRKQFLKDFHADLAAFLQIVQCGRQFLPDLMKESGVTAISSARLWRNGDDQPSIR
jgi:hypothetical protein